MITIYTNQNVLSDGYNMNPNTPDVYSDDSAWWMIYNADDSTIILEPRQSSGYKNTPFTIVISDTQEELNNYIQTNSLILSRSLRKNLVEEYKYEDET
jgi:hypothetical protein